MGIPIEIIYIDRLYTYINIWLFNIYSTLWDIDIEESMIHRSPSPDEIPQ